MSEIKTRIFNYGNEKEAEWPPKFGTNNGRGGRFYRCKKTGVIKEGSPPSEIVRFGEAPQVIFDSMPPEYHPDEGRVVESRKEWEKLDEKYNRITFGTREEVKRTTKKGVKQEEKELKADRSQATRQSIQAWKENPKEMAQKLDKQSEAQYESAKKAGLITKIKSEIKEQKK